MVVTVTLNPLLERRIFHKNIEIGKLNRHGRITLQAGGKGINVSRQLNLLNIQNLAVTFAGRSNGEFLKDLLKQEGIRFVYTRTETRTREAFIFVDKKAETVTTCFGENQEINIREAEEFLVKLERIIASCKIIVFAGSSPSHVTNFIFPRAIEMANKYDRISICDTYGSNLKDCIEAAPTIIHNNLDELRKSLDLPLKTKEDKINLLNHLYSLGIKQTFLTDGENPFYCSNFDYHYKVNFPALKPVDSTGSGDAFTAGLVYGWDKDLAFDQMVKAAVSLGAANAAVYDTCSVPEEKISEYEEFVEVAPAGKKMKLFDAAPH